MIKTKLDYFSGHEDGKFRINASGISRYFTSTSSWYRERMHGEDGFTGSTASVLGSVVHYALETFVKNELLDEQEIYQYVQNQREIVSDLDVDYILSQWPQMFAITKDYLQYELDESCVAERFITQELLPGITVGGSIDLHSSNSVTDYKTTSAKYPPKSIAYAWKLQLLTYAKLLRDEGYNIQYIRVISISTYIDGGISEKTGKPLKSYPSTVTVLEEPITPEDLEMMDNIFTLISKSVETYIKNPHLRPLLAQDVRVSDLPCTVTLPQDEEI